jgi:hypothetical protein
MIIHDEQSRGSSVSIASDYRLVSQVIRVRSLAEAKDFSSSLCVEIGSAAHLASYPMGKWGPFPGVKCSQGMTLTSHPNLVLRSRMNRSYTSSAPCRLHSNSVTALLYVMNSMLLLLISRFSQTCGYYSICGYL